MPVRVEEPPQKTHALSRILEVAIERLRTEPGKDERSEAEPSALLYLGNWYDAYPRLLVEDPHLSPAEKIVWQVIKNRSDPARPAAFPAQAALCRAVNCSRTALQTAIAVLRCLRWLTVSRVRSRSGRFAGNVYLLHDEPLEVAEAANLDPTYLPPLERFDRHWSPRIRKVAHGVLRSLRACAAQGQDLSAARTLGEQREARFAALQRSAGALDFPEDALPPEYYAITSPAGKEPAHGGPLPAHDQDQNLVMAPCSSSDQDLTTTTTAGGPQAEVAHATEGLIFPQLSTAEQALAGIYLAPVPSERRQDLLDELSGRMQQGRSSARPIDNPIGYLARLCQSAEAGTFQITSAALRVRERRAREAELREAARPTAGEAQLPPASINGRASALVRRVQEIEQRARARAQARQARPP